MVSPARRLRCAGGPFIEVDCTPTITEIGRFFSQCHLSEVHFANTTVAVPLVSCERIADAGGWTGTVNVFVKRPEAITIGQSVMVGGTDPIVTVVAISGSVIMGLVQTIPDSDAGAVVFDVLDPGLEPGRSIRGRFVDVTFSRYPRPPTYTCRISNSEFVALY